MKPPIRILLALYPKKWRERYGTELEALLEDVQPSSRDLADLAWGGIKMQMKRWGFAKLVAAFAVAGLIVGGISALMVKSTYVSTAIVRLTGDPDDFAHAETNVLSRTSLSYVIQKNDLYHDERTREPLEDVIERMRKKDIHIAAKQGEINAFQVSFSSTDPARAQAVTAILINRLSHNVPINPGHSLEVIESPQLPKAPVAPNRVLIAALGLAAGIIVGLVVAGMRKIRRRTLAFAGAFGVAGVLISLIPSYFLVPNQYTSSSVIRIRPTTSGDRIIAALRSQVAEQHLNNVGIETVGAAPKVAVYRITATDRDQRIAQGTNQRVIAIAGKIAINEFKVIGIIDPANYPLTPSAPNRYLIAFLGLGAGILSGGATARFSART
jgi:capsular polysaccharide biosynthesis protein